MKKKQLQWALSALMSAVITCVVAIGVGAQNKTDNKDELNQARDEAREAAEVLTALMKKPDDFIPQNLLKEAEAIAIFPDVIKAAFIFGGTGGDGVIARRTPSGWSAPVFFNIGGGSFGAQIGVKETDYIMLFMNDDALDELMDEKVEFGGNLSFAAGPVGRTVGASTTPTIQAGILTWSNSEGAFIGASIKGAVIDADNDVNRAVYGMKASEILANPGRVKTTGLPSEVTNFSRSVERYAGKP